MTVTPLSLYKRRSVFYRNDTNTLAPKKPLPADVSMFATVPTLGISYVDAAGKTHGHIVYQSGKDSSVLLTKEDF